MTSSTPDAPTLTQLAVVRLLYLHGVEQAAQPEPLSLFSLFTFHDAVELFLVLAADHLGMPTQKNEPKFMDYWHLLPPTSEFAAGVNLSGKGRMERLNRNRNAFKHVGANPSQSAVDEALRDTTSFFEDNTEAVFGVAFDAIDMADVVPQEDIRKLLKAAEAAEGAGDRREAMAGLTLAFAKLFRPYARSQHSPYAFGREMPPNMTSDGMAAELHSLAKEMGSKRAGNLRSAAQKADRNVSQLNTAVSAMQRGMRVLALGIDYGSFTRFEQLTPMMIGDEDQRMLMVEHDYAPNRAEYDHCVQFVITAALRVAEVDANAVEPSWERARVAGMNIDRELLTPPT